MLIICLRICLLGFGSVAVTMFPSEKYVSLFSMEFLLIFGVAVAIGSFHNRFWFISHKICLLIFL